MGPHPFIFSEARSWRLQRHVAFWACWWLAQTVLYSFTPGVMRYSYLERLEISGLDAFLFLGPHIFLSYSLMYYLIPKVLVKGKYVQAVITTVFLFFATATLSALIAINFIDMARQCMLGVNNTIPGLRYKDASFFLSLMAGLRGSITIGGVAAAIKLMKYWYVKQIRNLELQKENIASQLQLLKAQVHPHFLFNTLNNIYAHTQVGSPNAPMLVAGLSDMLRYMLYECDRPLVPLDKELKMLQDYVLLERVRYGNKLDINIQLSGNSKTVYIAPLLLLPFIENCFKHGASQILEQPWVTLEIVIEDDWMKMKLLNGKAPGIISSGGGIGIANVVQRLEYLYPGKHQLVINNEDEVFIVNLKLQLERRPATAGQMANTNIDRYELAQ